ncbi:MAG: hypothetical protein Q9180_006118, partial [Flavoplaca navasiana]
RITKLSTPMGGFGKDGIRKSVASYPASQFDPSACEEYDGEYGEDFGAEYGEEYGEGSEDREDLEEGHEQEHKKECAITYHFLIYVVLERVVSMSSQGAWKSSINPNIAFEPASDYTLRQKGVPEWRDYNRQLTAAYDELKQKNELLVVERDALKRKNMSLQRDVRELEDALDASGPPATAGPSEELRIAHSKIAELESALKQARSLPERKDREIVTLGSKLETAGQGSMGTRGPLEKINHDKSHHNEETEQANRDGRYSSSPEPHFQIITPGDRPLDSDLETRIFESASEPGSPVGAQAPMELGRSSVPAGSFPGQPSSLAGRLAQTSLSPAFYRPTSSNPQSRPVRKTKEARHDSRSPSSQFQVAKKRKMSSDVA